MKVNGTPYRTIWDEDGKVMIIDQRKLPHEFVTVELQTVEDTIKAIKEFYVRGAGLIGATGGYGMYLAAKQANGNETLFNRLAKELSVARPTATNLQWAVDRQLEAIVQGDGDISHLTLQTAREIADEDAEFCRRIGVHGRNIIEDIYNMTKEPVNILTHCNAGWLAFVDYGSATAPIYAAHDAGIPVHVWVDETRPWNQGAKLTEWELNQHGVPCTLKNDSSSGHLMQRGQVDMVIVGTDRTTYTGYVANKIGTNMIASSAKQYGIPFYVALPSSTFDWKEADGLNIPIEERSGDEIRYATGEGEHGMTRVLVSRKDARTYNQVFDVTEPENITALITERGIVKPNPKDILNLYPEKSSRNMYIL